MAIPKSEINAAYLHSNSTSHTWVFSAFAEMIDNAYDPDVKATEISIDKVDIGKNTCLIFEDNGSGMNKDKLHKMLSFGYCDKHKYDTIGKHQPIGNYGNGFKSGSMRIARPHQGNLRLSGPLSGQAPVVDLNLQEKVDLEISGQARYPLSYQRPTKIGQTAGAVGKLKHIWSNKNVPLKLKDQAHAVLSDISFSMHASLGP
ncbi:MORC family CW-type Zinc finger protein 3 [Plakobranchus ocellatus]|uniref:MORC family CW-type Zinc finger protein 3 n=1 Tax=Plakobranchus ocellatus TaxID=259542 RepID=A0AAV4AY61_9GAST|nr:MORC family CW-type Zinc finger protein 3 [Plakobranchus ocellatus]